MDNKQKTFVATNENVDRKWYIVDAKDKVLGRLATEVASVLRGKHKATFQPNVDTGDYVIVVNCEKVRLTGNKENQKVYQRYSGYAGGLKEIKYLDMKNQHPERIIEHAVRGMLPKNRLGRQMIKKLRVFKGENHPHTAQKPEVLEVK